MSDAHNEQQSLIKTPRQLIVAVALGFLVPIITIILIVNYVASNNTSGAGSDAMTPEAIAERLQPVADIKYSLADVSGPKQLMTGEAVYKASCAACHATGAAGAPKFGDAGAWAARIAQGQSTVVSHAINGLRGMPAKGGNANLADIEVERAVVYMVNNSGGKFKEPEAKGDAPAAAANGAAEAPAQAAAPAAAAVDGKKTYDMACTACHTAGIAGAPKLGDKGAWEARIAQGKDTLYKHAIEGFQGKAGVMPPRGGSSASDEEIKAAVDYMVSAAK